MESVERVHRQKSSTKSGASRIRSGVELMYRSLDVMVNASICRARSLGSNEKNRSSREERDILFTDRTWSKCFHAEIINSSILWHEMF